MILIKKITKLVNKKYFGTQARVANLLFHSFFCINVKSNKWNVSIFMVILCWGFLTRWPVITYMDLDRWWSHFLCKAPSLFLSLALHTRTYFPFSLSLSFSLPLPLSLSPSLSLSLSPLLFLCSIKIYIF